MDRDELLKQAFDLREEMIAIRREIHRHPELGRKEYRTASYIEEKLHSFGIETQRLTETGIVGILRGKKEHPCVLFRSDMDALPIEEKTDLPFTSENIGVMHACGHDMHMAALLGCAAILSSMKDELNGTVKFLFEPDEEGDGGALDMIHAGSLENPHVDVVFGAHCNPDLPAGTIGIKYGSFYAAAALIDVIVNGKGSHGAEPEKGTDALYAGALICAALKEMTQGEGDDRLVVSVGQFTGGTARNIIPETVSLHGILRTCGIDRRAAAMKEAEKKIQTINAKTGTSADIHIKAGYPGVVNHDYETALAEQTAVELFGRNKVIVEKVPTMTTEDFGYFLLERPGCFYHIGVGSPYGLHNARFSPNEDALITAAAMHAGVIMNYLESAVR